MTITTKKIRIGSICLSLSLFFLPSLLATIWLSSFLLLVGVICSKHESERETNGTKRRPTDRVNQKANLRERERERERKEIANQTHATKLYDG